MNSRLAGCAVAAMLAVPSAAFVAAPAVSVVAIEFNSNHVIVPVDWQGRRLAFVLDTGAPRSFLDLHRAQAAGLRITSTYGATGAGPGSTAAGTLGTPIRVNVPTDADPVQAPIAAVIDLTDIAAHAGRDLDGILGADFVGRFVVEIDYAGGKLRLHDPGTFGYTGKGSTVPLMFRNSYPLVHASLKVSDTEAVDVAAVLDVGSSLAVAVTQPIAERYQLAERLHATEPLPVGRGAGGAAQSRVARLPAVTIGGVTIANPVTTLAEPNSGVMSSTSIFEVNIGGALMRHFTMFFDYSRARVTLEPNANFGEPFEFDMSGLSLTTGGPPFDRILVENVRAGSPAALAGIKTGDRLVSVEGKSAPALTLEELRQRFRVKGALYRLALERGSSTLNVSIEMRPLV